ncbi:hypothetical protein SRABI76_01764 [Microbacterium oxydans]|uniref:Uncharacterized protein n=2 Tax=Microbacterium oxydans TaxID=82380 RepID=A0A0F0L943_9MICO|nr:hypothetical protein [Microbacterium oxydans]KJL29194.1 hypothetical protein RS83_01820 [Microbacterium oxydans]CAH0190658.1 hypothetical protein SRABI76_01764 [Microbacterium oxydans]
MTTTPESGRVRSGPSSARRILIAVGLVMFAVFAVAAWVCFGVSATLASSVGGEYLFMTGEVPWERHPLYDAGIYAGIAFALAGAAFAGAVLAASLHTPVRVRHFVLPVLVLGAVAAVTYYVCWMLAPAAT